MSWLSNLWSKENIGPFDPSKLLVDMHSHLIPGIDDGSQSMEDTIQLLHEFKALGYKKIITTPHIKTGSFENNQEIIKAGEKEVKAAMVEYNVDLEFEAAAEYFFDYTFMEKIESGDLLTFCDNHILVEFAFGQPPVGENEMFFALQMKGYKPILAHFERYAYYHGSVKLAETLRDKGIKIQLNLGSLYGQYGPQIQRQAELMLKENVIDLVATDCHRIEHMDLYKSNLNHKNMSKLMDLTFYNSKML